MAMTKGTSGSFGSMNVTPLIDVLLTLLVIFMIITPITPKGENALIPQPPVKNSKPVQNSRSVVLQLIANPQQGRPQLEINQQSVSWQDLNSELVDIYKTRAQRVLFIKADNGIPWQDVAAAIDDAHTAGINQVGLITAKIEAGG